jgi:hypothetical protein
MAHDRAHGDLYEADGMSKSFFAIIFC